VLKNGSKMRAATSGGIPANAEYTEADPPILAAFYRVHAVHTEVREQPLQQWRVARDVRQIRGGAHLCRHARGRSHADLPGDPLAERRKGQRHEFRLEVAEGDSHRRHRRLTLERGAENDFGVAVAPREFRCEHNAREDVVRVLRDAGGAGPRASSFVWVSPCLIAGPVFPGVAPLRVFVNMPA
jgi:hypothetical protein